MESFTVTLRHDKTTKGTGRWSTSDEDAPIRSVYIQKAAVGEQLPAIIKVTVEQA